MNFIHVIYYDLKIPSSQATFPTQGLLYGPITNYGLFEFLIKDTFRLSHKITVNVTKKAAINII